MSFPGGANVKDPSANAGDIRNTGSIPFLGRFPGGRHDNPLQYSFPIGYCKILNLVPYAIH